MLNDNLVIELEPKSESQYNSQLVSTILEQLVTRGILPHVQKDNENFSAFLEKVSNAFIVDESAITTKMARFLYSISFIVKPRNVLVVGSFQGNSLVWLAGGCDSNAFCIGVDTDHKANMRARSNFLSVGMTNVQIYDLDGHDASSLFFNDIDLILLDADDQYTRKRIYMSLTEALYPKLKPNGLLLAHDMLWPAFQDDLKDFRCLMSDKKLFAASAILPIDRYGVSICRKVS